MSLFFSAISIIRANDVRTILDEVGHSGKLRREQDLLDLRFQPVAGRDALPESCQSQLSFNNLSDLLRQIHNIADSVFIVDPINCLLLSHPRLIDSRLTCTEQLTLEHSKEWHLLFSMQSVCWLVAGIDNARPQLL